MKVALLPAVTAEQRAAEEKANALNKLVWITCRVCGLRSKVGLDNPALLCQPCRVDPTQTEAHVLHLRDTYRARLVEASAIWEGAVARAGAEAQQRWERVEEARVRVAAGELEMAAFAATWRRARTAGGAFSLLLSAYETYEEACDQCNEGLERCEAALIEVQAYMAPSETLYQLTEGRATYGVVVRAGIVIDCAPYGYKRWMGKTEDALISASAVLAPPAPAGRDPKREGGER